MACACRSASGILYLPSDFVALPAADLRYQMWSLVACVVCIFPAAGFALRDAVHLVRNARVCSAA